MSSDSAITVPFQMAVVMHVTVRAATDLFHRRRSVAADPRDAAAVLGLADEVPEHPRPPGDVGQRVGLVLGGAAVGGEAEPAFHSATDRWSAMIGSRKRLLVAQVLLSADQAGQHAEFLAETS